eukprot:g8012.t1
MSSFEFATLLDPSTIRQCWKGHFTRHESPQLLINRGHRLEVCSWSDKGITIDHQLTSAETQVSFCIPLHQSEIWSFDFVLFNVGEDWMLTQWNGEEFKTCEFSSQLTEESLDEHYNRRINGIKSTRVVWNASLNLALFVTQSSHGWITLVEIRPVKDKFPYLIFHDIELGCDLKYEDTISSLFYDRLPESYWQQSILIDMELLFIKTEFRLLLLMKNITYMGGVSFRVITMTINIDNDETSVFIHLIELPDPCSLLVVKEEGELVSGRYEHYWPLGKDNIPINAVLSGSQFNDSSTEHNSQLEGNPVCYEYIDTELIIIATDIGSKQLHLSFTNFQSEFYLMTTDTEPVLTPVEVDGVTTCPLQMTLLNSGQTQGEIGVLFVAGNASDSVLLLTKTGTENYSVREKWSRLYCVIAVDSLSPIRDFHIIPDPLNSHELQLLVCSGSSPFGTVKKCSLSYSIDCLSIAPTKLQVRIHTSCVTELLLVQNGVKLLKCKAECDDEFDGYLCMSYNDGISQWSQILDIQREPFSITELPGFDSSHSTLLLESIRSSRGTLLIQVTDHEVRVLHSVDGVQSIWTDLNQISKCSYCEQHLALASINELILIKVESTSCLTVIHRLQQFHQISTLNILQFDKEGDFALAVGEWFSNEIQFYSIPELSSIGVISIGKFHPRSILMTPQSSRNNTGLLVGTNNGFVLNLTGSFTPESDFQSSSISYCQIGSTEVSLSVICKGKILAASDQSAVLEFDEMCLNITRLFLGRGRCQSLVTLHLQNSSIDDNNWLGWITEHGELRFGRLQSNRKLHWTTSRIGFTPMQSLLHLKSASLLISSVDDGNDSRWCLMLMDPCTLKILTSWKLPYGHSIDSMMETKLPYCNPWTGSLSQEDDWGSFIIIWTHVDEQNANAKLSVFQISVSPVLDGLHKKELLLIGAIPLLEPVFCSAIAFVNTLPQPIVSKEQSPATKVSLKGETGQFRDFKWTGNWPVIISGNQSGFYGTLLAILDSESLLTEGHELTSVSNLIKNKNPKQIEDTVLNHGRLYYHRTKARMTEGAITSLSTLGSRITCSGFLSSSSIFVLKMHSEELHFVRVLGQSDNQITLLVVGEQNDLDDIMINEMAEPGPLICYEVSDWMSPLFALFSGVHTGKLGLHFQSSEEATETEEAELVFYTSTGGVYSNDTFIRQEKNTV